MTKKDYQELADKPGDCWSRCIEFCLGIDPGSSDIPRPGWEHVSYTRSKGLRLRGSYFTEAAKWCHSRGVFLIDLSGCHEIEPGFWSPAWLNPKERSYPLVIWSGWSRDINGLGHSVVSRGYLEDGVVFDPSGIGVSEVLSLTIPFFDIAGFRRRTR